MKILIIRSTSIQRLALVLKRLNAEYPGAEIDLLAHRHSMGSLWEMDGINSILPYPSNGDFSPFTVPGPAKNRYDLVVVPATNISGAGYENVMLLALRLQSGRVALINNNMEIVPLPPKEIFKRTLALFASIPVALLGALAMTGISLVWMALVWAGGRMFRGNPE